MEEQPAWKPPAYYEKLKCVTVVAYIRHNPTGEVREYRTSEYLEEGESNPPIFCWSEGNFGCDCNRDIFYHDAEEGYENDNIACGEELYSVNLENTDTGEIYHREYGVNHEPRSGCY